MEKSNSNTTKFTIVFPDEFKKILNPLGKKFRIHIAAEESVYHMEERISEKKGVNPDTLILDASHSRSTIRKGIKNQLISQSVLHSIFCLLLNKISDDKYNQPYTSKSIKAFINVIKLEYNEPGSVKKFKDFFSQLDIPEKFGKGYEIQIDQNWEFSILESNSNIELKPEIVDGIKDPFKDDVLKSAKSQSDSISEIGIKDCGDNDLTEKSENETPSKKGKDFIDRKLSFKKKYKVLLYTLLEKNKKRILLSLGIVLCISLLFFPVYGWIGSKENPVSKKSYPFVLDPARRGNGTSSIKFNFSDKELDTIDVNNMRNKDTIYFYVSLSYQNATSENLTNVYAKMLYSRNGNASLTSFETVLYAHKGLSVLDKTYIKNLPNSWKIEHIEAHAQNDHGKECGENYQYDIILNIEKLTTEGVRIPDLDTKESSQRNEYLGGCSQGAVIAKFRLLKVN
jgi:hypothetical protein